MFLFRLSNPERRVTPPAAERRRRAVMRIIGKIKSTARAADAPAPRDKRGTS